MSKYIPTNLPYLQNEQRDDGEPARILGNSQALESGGSGFESLLHLLPALQP